MHTPLGPRRGRRECPRVCRLGDYMHFAKLCGKRVLRLKTVSCELRKEGRCRTCAVGYKIDMSGVLVMAWKISVCFSTVQVGFDPSVSALSSTPKLFPPSLLPHFPNLIVPLYMFTRRSSSVSLSLHPTCWRRNICLTLSHTLDS